MQGAFFYVDAGRGHSVHEVALGEAMNDMGEEAVVEDLFIIFKAPLVRWVSEHY